MESLLELEERITRCRRCPRLVDWRERVAREKRRAFRDEIYWGRPVPGWGDPRARVLVVGLAPGAHGGNRTGRMFTGDGSGDFLFRSLHHAGFANGEHPVSRDDGLALRDLFLAAVCRCAPPANKPLPGEIANCMPYLEEELALLERTRVIVALGGLAYGQVVRRLAAPAPPLAAAPPFGHGVSWRGVRPTPAGDVPVWVIASYHPSQQNTNTGKLTPAMFNRIWTKAADALIGKNIKSEDGV